MEMTITRALSELKLLNSRIERKITETTFITANKKSAKKVNNVFTKEEFIENSKSGYQSVLDLIERRKQIKSAIVDSNAKTIVKIADKEMSVAEAIERKDSIQYDKMLLESMTRQYNTSVAKVNQQNEAVQQQCDRLLETMLGTENKSKANKDEISAITTPYLEQNEWELIDPMTLFSKINSLKTDIEQFESEVDFILGESNCITKISISD